MYVACPPQILIRDRGLASALCPGMLGRCEEPGLSGDGLCQVPLDGRPYLARVAVGLDYGYQCGREFDPHRGKI